MSEQTVKRSPQPDRPPGSATDGQAIAPAPPDLAPGRKSRRNLIGIAEAYALVALIGITFVFFSFYGPTAELFPTSANLKLLVASQSVLALVALAALVPLVAGEWDLSVGATAGVSSIYVASALSSGMAVPVAIGIGLAIGIVVGAANGLIVTGFKVSAVIPTLGMATILFGIVTAKTGGLAIVSDIPASVTDFGSGDWFGIPSIAYVMVGVALLVYYLLNYTPLGRYLYAIGSNRSAAELVGIRTGRAAFWSFVIAGMLAGAAGALQVARAGGANPSVGEGFTLPALAAAFLSAASIKPGRYNVAGVIVAIFFLAVLNNGLNLAGAPNYVSDLVNGTALIVGVGFAAVLGRKRTAA